MCRTCLFCVDFTNLFLITPPRHSASSAVNRPAYRSHGVRYGSEEVYRQSARGKWLRELPNRASRQQMELLYRNLDHLEEDRYWLLNRLKRVASRHPVVKMFLEIPG